MRDSGITRSALTDRGAGKRGRVGRIAVWTAALTCLTLLARLVCGCRFSGGPISPPGSRPVEPGAVATSNAPPSQDTAGWSLPAWLAWSPSGRYIAAIVSGPRARCSVLVVEVGSGKGWVVWTDRSPSAAADLFNEPDWDPWSPDERSLAFVDLEPAQVSIVTIGGAAERVIPMPGARDAWYARPGCVSWSPDGRSVALLGEPTLGDRRCVLLDTSGSGLLSTPLPSELLGRPHWSPDGASLMLRTRQTFLRVDAGSGEVHSVPLDPPLHTSVFPVPRWASNDTVAFVPYGKASIYTVDLRSGHVEAIRSSATGSPVLEQLGFSIVSIAPNLRWFGVLAQPRSGSGGSALGDPSIYTYDMVADRLFKVYAEPAVGHVAWAPDGDHIAFVVHNRIYTAAKNGSGLRLLWSLDRPGVMPVLKRAQAAP